MKIEVCESLVSSWFKHVKKCSLVQTNWTVSPYWGIDYTRFDKVCNEINQVFSGKYDIITGASIDQFIKQGEADVVGIRIENNKTTVYAADSAFHENGLHYKNNVSKVLQKYFRTALTLSAVYGDVSGEIAFISPKILTNTLECLIPAIEKLQYILIDNGFNFTLELYANDGFISKVLTPVLEKIKTVSDDNELFLRSIQLGSMAKDFKRDKKTVIHDVSEIAVSPTNRSSVNPYAENEELFALGEFKKYLKGQGITEDDIKSHCYVIEKFVLGVEHKNWNTLTYCIDEIMPLYDEGGKHYGKYCQGTVTVADALKKFSKFVHDNNGGINTTTNMTRSISA